MNGAFLSAGDLYPELARLQQHLEEVFQTGSGTNIRGRSTRGAFPAVNVGTTPETVEVIVFVPGVERQALEISVDRGLLIIAGERSASADRREQDNVHAQERFVGAFRRVVSLPEDADPAQVEAKVRDGILHITVAKRESSKPRRIAVN